jgi:hypothetical protein
LESWERREHRAQVALRAFVAHVRELIDPVIERTQGELAFRLDVGLVDDVDPLWERDLDNYLFPIARTLPDRVACVWGTKGRAERSYVRLERAVEVARPDGWQAWEVPRTTGNDRYVKAAVRRAVAGTVALPAGPVALQLGLVVAPGRNWMSTWKPAVDGLEPLLGRTYDDRDWNPLDGRVVRLGLHRTVDRAFENDVAITVHSRAADESWPELRWFAEMTPDERETLIGRDRSHRGGGAAGLASDPRIRRLRAHERINGVQLAGVEIFEDDDAGYLSWVAAHPSGYVVNIQRTRNPSDARLHYATCRTVSGENPRRGPWTGAYIKACSEDLNALDAWALSGFQAPITRCGTCHPPAARTRESR